MIRVAIADSGVYASHPHVGGVAGGVWLDEAGAERGDYVDRLGHGTAVTAAIREKAPRAELFAVKIFDRALATNIGTLVAAIRWSIRHGMDLLNLSLGTAKAAHEPALREAVADAVKAGVLIVAASHDEGVAWYPGCLPGVLGVEVDWHLPRDRYSVDAERSLCRASGYPRPIPGVPPERNLKGISFAVANVTGFVADEFERSSPVRDARQVASSLRARLTLEQRA